MKKLISDFKEIFDGLMVFFKVLVIAIVTIPLLDSSIEMFERVSLDLWNPGTTITRGQGLLTFAETGLNKSATTHWPFCVGILIDSTLTCPQDDCISEAK